MPGIHRHAPLSLPVLIAVLVAAGCGVHEAGPGGPPALIGSSEAERQSASARISIRVENQQLEDVTVYLVRQGVLVRLGVAEGYGTRIFRVPRALFGSGMGIALRAESIGSRRRYESPFFHAEPGQAYRWTVNNRPGLSSLAVVVPDGTL